MLDIHFVNVGNGDCTIIDHQGPTGRAVGVVDCNSAGSASSPAVKKLQDLGVTELSFVCLTHPDRDHYSGLFSVLSQFTLQHFYTFPCDMANNPKVIKRLAEKYRELQQSQDDPLVLKQTKEFLQIIMYATQNYVPDKWEELTGPCNTIAPTGFSEVEFQCLLPLKFHKGDFFEYIRRGNVGVESSVENNKVSVVLRLSYAGKTVLLGADAPADNWDRHKNVWQRKLSKSIASDIVKLPHHGSRHDCTVSVLDDIVKDSEHTITVVSADGKRHPHQEVIGWLHSKTLRNCCTNLFAGYGGSVRKLLNEKTLDPVLNRLLNEYCDADLTYSQPCQGDIRVRIQQDGSHSILCSSNFTCLCDPAFRSLLGQAV